MRYQESLRRILPFMERTLEMYKNGNQFFMGDQVRIYFSSLLLYCNKVQSTIPSDHGYNDEHQQCRYMCKKLAYTFN